MFDKVTIVICDDEKDQREYNKKPSMPPLEILKSHMRLWNLMMVSPH